MGNIDLKLLYPQSRLYYFLLLAPGLLLAALGAAGLAVLRHGAALRESLPPALHDMLALGAIAIILAGALRVIYEALAVRRYRYGLISDHVVVSRGAFLRQESSFPLTSVTDIRVGNSWWGFPFGLYYLDILTPTEQRNYCSRIEGLSRGGALGLKDDLVRAMQECLNARRTEEPPAAESLPYTEDEIRRVAKRLRARSLDYAERGVLGP